MRSFIVEKTLNRTLDDEHVRKVLPPTAPEVPAQTTSVPPIERTPGAPIAGQRSYASGLYSAPIFILGLASGFFGGGR